MVKLKQEHKAKTQLRELITEQVEEMALNAINVDLETTAAYTVPC